MNNNNKRSHKKRKIVAIFFRLNPIDSLIVLLYACNGSMYNWLSLYKSSRTMSNRTKLYRIKG